MKMRNAIEVHAASIPQAIYVDRIATIKPLECGHARITWFCNNGGMKGIYHTDELYLQILNLIKESNNV